MRDLSEVDSAFLQVARETPAPEYVTGAVMRRLPAMPPPLPARRGLAPWAAGVAVACVQVIALGGAYWWGFLHGTGAGHTASSTTWTVPAAPARTGAAPTRGANLPVVMPPAAAPAVRRGIFADPRFSAVDGAAYLEQVGPPRSLAVPRRPLPLSHRPVLNGAY
jgi:hypothetical protein